VPGGFRYAEPIAEAADAASERGFEETPNCTNGLSP
jgi:hypothetical protein